jgi:hypothetical protein
MPPLALIPSPQLSASKFVPDVVPVPESSTSPNIGTGPCCATAAVAIESANDAPSQNARFMILLLLSVRRTRPRILMPSASRMLDAGSIPPRLRSAACCA